MRFTCKIEMDNAAFEDNPYELAEMLQKISAKTLIGHTEGKVLDTNGATVGSWRITGRKIS